MWEILTGEEPYANMHCGAIIGKLKPSSLSFIIADSEMVTKLCLLTRK